jgi:Tfp pilus assembly protein PilZ
MSDPVNMARTARERLAQGLAALQSPGVPAGLLNVAEPVAHAMSALHQIEASQGAARPQAAPLALDSVRRALGALQGDVSNHPAVVRATEAIASSLALVHGLTQAPGAAPAQAAQPPRAAAPQNLAFAGTMVAEAAPPATQPSPAGARPPAAAAPQPAPPQQRAPAAQPAPAVAPQARQPAPVAQAPAAQPAPAPAAGGLTRVDAELGVHSPSNFYKGLSGNDVIDSGGIFIATYQIPPIGRELLIHVSMPGGYEFQAKGVVRWTREAPLSSAGGLEAPPGFGAQFTDISPEGRQLVYRYVRNREPLFHDDL